MKLKVPTALAPLRIDALNSNIRLPEMKLSRIECTVQLFGMKGDMCEVLAYANGLTRSGRSSEGVWHYLR